MADTSCGSETHRFGGRCRRGAARSAACMQEERAVDDFDRRMLELAGRQHYVVAREQLRDFGTDRQIEHRLAKRLLESVHEGVYRVAGSPDTWRQRLMAACLAELGRERRVVSRGRAVLRPARRRGGRRGDRTASPADATRRRHHARELLPDRSRRHLRRRHPGHAAGAPAVRSRAARRARRAPSAHLRARGAGGDPSQSGRHSASLARMGTARRCAAAGWTNRRRSLDKLRPAPTQPTDTRPEARLLQILRAAGLPEPVPQFRVALSRTRTGASSTSRGPKRSSTASSIRTSGTAAAITTCTARPGASRLEMLGWRGVPVTDDELDSGARLATQLLLQRLPRPG